MMQNNPAPALLRFIFSSLLLGMMAAYGVSLLSVDVPIDLQARYLPPGASHWFGTDNMGRDLWLRCFQGALTSLQIGVGAAICSGVIAMLIASLTLIHPVMDQALRLIIDTLLSLPHLLLLILICFTVGGGMRGVVLAVAFTHWPKSGADPASRSPADSDQRLHDAGSAYWKYSLVLLAGALSARAFITVACGHITDVPTCCLTQRSIKFSWFRTGAS